MLGPAFGRRSNGICDTSQGKRAAAVSSGYEASLGPNTGSAWARFVCSTMFPTRPSKSWRSSPNRRLTYGWLDTQVPSETGSAVRTQGRPLALSAGGREARDRHHPPWKASRSADRLPVRRRLVRLSPGERPALSPADRKGATESASRARREDSGCGGNTMTGPGRRLFLRHSRLAQTDEISGFDQGADFRPPRSN